MGVLINITVTDGDIRVVIGTLLTAIGIIIFISEGFLEDQPTAMDVYNGKTTLEITYKDGIPIDTVVVYKEKQL